MTSLTEEEEERKKKERKTFWLFGDFWFGIFMMLFCATRCVVVHETLEDEWYIDIKAYKCTVLKIFLYCHIFILCVRTTHTYRVY